MDAPAITDNPGDNPLGLFLKDRRAKIDPAALGYSNLRRRTPGLRREEVAQRANISPAWYTWLEQGRGGAPSSEVLDRIATALLLEGHQREHLFLLALGRPPAIRFQPVQEMPARLQRVLDALTDSPALVKTFTWDLLAWNRAAGAVFGYDALAADERNILRRMFCDPRARAAQLDWESVARIVVAAFRADIVRAGATAHAEALVDELSARSPEFAAMWRENDVRNFGEGIKQLNHSTVGLITMEYSSFAVDGRSDLSMLIYNPVTPIDIDLIRSLMAA